MENKKKLSDEVLSTAAGGTFADFRDLRKQMELFCTQLQAKTSANPADRSNAAKIQQALTAAMENEPQCIYFLQEAGNAAKLLQDEKLRDVVLSKLDQWCDIIYQ